MIDKLSVILSMFSALLTNETGNHDDVEIILPEDAFNRLYNDLAAIRKFDSTDDTEDILISAHLCMFRIKKRKS